MARVKVLSNFPPRPRLRRLLPLVVQEIRNMGEGANCLIIRTKTAVHLKLASS